MNFLSHLYLSGNSEGLILGNFIADSVKGSDYKNYTPEIQQGILLHRKIDFFTDTHPIVELSKQRLRAKFQSNMELSIHYLVLHFDLFEKEFITFFPYLKDYVAKQIPDNNF